MRKTVVAFFVKLTICLPASAQTHADTTFAFNKITAFAGDTAKQRPVFLPPLIPANFYAAHLPFFCSTELKVQKALKFPVKFRLGSVESCDRLEGKHQK